MSDSKRHLTERVRDLAARFGGLVDIERPARLEILRKINVELDDLEEQLEAAERENETLRDKLASWEEAEDSAPSWEQVDGANQRFVDAVAERDRLREKLADIASREWRDEGGRIAAAIARDALASNPASVSEREVSGEGPMISRSETPASNPAKREPE